MTEFVDFADLKSKVSMEQVISYLGIRITKRDSAVQWRAHCPACRSKNPRSLSMNVKDNVFKCFADPRGRGDQISLVAHTKGISQREAAKLLHDHFLHSSQGHSEAREGERGDSETETPDVLERLDDLERRIEELERTKNVVTLRRA